MEKIIIEDGLCYREVTGIGQYSLMVENQLQNLGYEVESKRKYFIEGIKNGPLRRIVYMIWLNSVFLLKLLFKQKNTIVIYTDFMVPFIKLKKIKYVSVVYDLCAFLFPDTLTPAQRFYSKLSTEVAIKNADKIITISETVKKEISDYFKYPENKILVVNCSTTTDSKTDISIDEEALLNKFGIEKRKFILSVSSFNRRKNLKSLTEGFKICSNKYPNVKLVLVGPKGNDKQINDIDNENIILPGYISNEELIVLYKNAQFYMSPSIYEGFGIPVIDAQKFGLPVLCSDIPIYREIAGESALFCKPDKDSIATAIEKLIPNSDLQDKLGSLGIKNVERFKYDIIKDQIQEATNA